MKKKKIAELVKDLIEDLRAGKTKHWWDAAHQPREGERNGRVEMLLYILECIESD